MRWRSVTCCSASTRSGLRSLPRQLDLNRVEPDYYSWDVTIEDGLEYFKVTPGPILDRVMEGRYRGIRSNSSIWVSMWSLMT